MEKVCISQDKLGSAVVTSNGNKASKDSVSLWLYGYYRSAEGSALKYPEQQSKPLTNLVTAHDREESAL